MAGRTNNIDLIPKEDLQAVSDLDQRSKNLTQTLSALLAVVLDTNKAFRDSASFKERQKHAETVDNTEKAYNKTVEEAIKLERERDKLRQKIAAADSEIAKEVANLRAEYEAKTKAVKAAAKAEYEASQQTQKAAEDYADSLIIVRGEVDNRTEAEREAAAAMRARMDADIQAAKDARELANSQLEVADSAQKVLTTDRDLLNVNEAAREAFGSLTGKIQEMSQNLAELKINQDQIKVSQKQLDGEYDKGNVSLEQYILKKAQLNTLEKQNADAIKFTNKQMQDSIKVATTAAGSYENISAQYSLMKAQINQLGEAEGDNIKIKRDIEEQAKRLYERMSDLQKATGKHQLDVGKYDIAVKDLTRTISLIDPKLGMIIRKIEQISVTQKKWTEINAKLVKSLHVTSATATALMAALVGLVAFGLIKLYEWTKKVAEEKNKLTQKQEQEIKINEEVGRSVGGLLASYKSLQVQWNNLAGDLNAKTKFVTENKDEFAKLGIAVENVDDAENVLVGNTEVVIKAMQLRAQAAAYQTIAAEKYAQAVRNMTSAEFDEPETPISAITDEAELASFNLQNNIKNLWHGVINELLSEGDELTKKQVDLLAQASELLESAGIKATGSANKQREKAYEQSLELRLKWINAEKKAMQDLATFWLNYETALQKEIASNENESYTKRLTALDKYIASRKQAINESASTQVENLIDGVVNDDKSGIMDRAQAAQLLATQIELINAKAWAEIVKVDKEMSSIREDINSQYADSVIKSIAKRAEAESDVLNSQESAELVLLAQQYQRGEIKAEEYEQRRTDIQSQYAKERYEAEAAMLIEQLGTLDLTAEQREKIMERLGKNELDYQKYLNDALIADDERAGNEREKIEEQLAQKRQQIWQETFKFISALMSAQTERQLAELDKRAEQASEADEAEKDRITRLEEHGAITKEEADARKALVDEQAKQREAELERKRVEIQRKQAIFEKAAAVTQIAIETALAIAKIKAQAAILAANPVTLPLAAVALAQIPLVVAAQTLAASTILAQPLPQYAEGTSDHPGGKAILGDGGRAEMVFYGGKFWKTPDKPTVVDLPKHAQVFPDYKEALANMAFVRLNGAAGERNQTIAIRTDALEEINKQGNKMLEQMQREIHSDRISKRYDNVMNKFKPNRNGTVKN